MPQRRYRSLFGGILAGLPNLVAAVFVISYLHTHGLDAPGSLANVIGGYASAFTWTVIFAMVGSGVLAFLQGHLGPMRAETVLRPLTGFFLLGYAAALVDGDKTPWITVGFVACAAIEQARRWFILVTREIPEHEALAVLIDEQTEDTTGGH